MGTGSTQTVATVSRASWRCRRPSCGLPLHASRPNRAYCSDHCRYAHWDETHPRRHQAAIPGESRVERAFEVWIETASGWEVENEVTNRALRLKRSGWKHYGVKAICEAVRFDSDVRVGPDAEGWKINNNFPSLLARRIMERCPDLAGFFETRRLHGVVKP